MRLRIYCLLIILIVLNLPHAHSQEGTQLEPITAQNAHRLTTQAVLGNGSVSAMAWASDGSMLAVATPFELRIYHAGQAAPIVEKQDSRILQLTFSADNQFLASLNANMTVQVWERSTGTRLIQWHTPHMTGYVQEVFFVDNKYLGMYVFENYEDISGRLWLLEWETGNVEQKVITSPSLRTPALLLHDDLFIVSRNDSQMGSGLNISQLMLWNATTGDYIDSIIEVRPRITQMLWLPDSEATLITLDEYGVVRFWDVKRFQELFALTLPEYLVTAIAVSPDGSRLITSGNDAKVRVWDTDDGSLLSIYPNQPNIPSRFHIESNGDIFAFGDKNYAHVWNVVTLEDKYSYDLYPMTAPLVKVGFRDNVVIGLGANGMIYRWDMKGNLIEQMQTVVPFATRESVILQDGEIIAAFNGRDNSLYVWHNMELIIFPILNAKGYQQLHIQDHLIFLEVCLAYEIDHGECFFPGAAQTIYVFSLDEGFRYIALSEYLFRSFFLYTEESKHDIEIKVGNDSLQIQEEASEALLISLSGHLAPINDFAFNTENTLLATASADGTIILWGVNSQ